MKIRMEIIPADDWKRDFSEAMHSIVFNAIKPGEWDRIDYAMLFIDEESNTPVGYITAREIDARAVYLQFGGLIPKYKGTGLGYQCFKMCVDMAKVRYEVVTMKVKNTNKAMLACAAKEDFLIVGVTQIRGSTMLEHILDTKREGDENG